MDWFRPNHLFVVPTFQRPFAWGQREIDLLVQDITQAHGRTQSSFHYLSPVHLIRVDTQDAAAVKLLSDYTDPQNLDFPIDSGTGLADDNGVPITVFMIVDGQQRLTTLFAMAHVLNLPGLTLTLGVGGKTIPKLMASTVQECRALCTAINLTSTLATGNGAAQRIADLFRVLHSHQPQLKQTRLFIQLHLKTLGVCIHPGFALGSFQTLNDRGKLLTILEKFKARCMFLDQFASSPDPHSVHQTFGKVYRSLDPTESPLDDERLIQAFALWSFTGQARPPGDWIYWGAEKWYSEKIAVTAAPTSAVSIASWVKTLDDLVGANDDVVSFLTGAAPTATNISQIQPASRTVANDYQSAIRRRKISHQALSVLLRFQSRFGCPLHLRAWSVTLHNGDTKQTVLQRLNLLDGRINAASILPQSKTKLQGQSSSIKTRLVGINDQEIRAVAVLDLVEMIDQCNVKGASYDAAWNTGFAPTSSVQQAMDAWIAYIESWGGRSRYLADFLSPGDTSHGSNLHLLSLEYEASLGKHWPLGNSHEVEHIFATGLAKMPDFLQRYHFTLPNDYDNFNNSLGNIMPLDSSLNRSIMHLEPNAKAQHYLAQTTLNGSICPPPGTTAIVYSPSAYGIGLEVQSLNTDIAATRYILDLRTIEQTVYAMVRY